MMLHIFPWDIILCQQIFFGNLSLDIKFAYIFNCPMGVMLMVSSSLLVCLLDKQMKIHHYKLIQLQFDSYLNFDVNTKLKVSFRNTSINGCITKTYRYKVNQKFYYFFNKKASKINLRTFDLLASLY